MTAPRNAPSLGLRAFIVAFVGVLCWLPARAQLTTIIWNLSASDNWNNSTLWTPQTIPSLASHKAEIVGGTVNMSDVPRSIGALSLSGGTLAGTQILTLTDTGSTWTGGTMAGAGGTTIAAGASITVSGTGHTLNGRTFTNALNGSVFFDPTNAMTLSGTGTMENSGTWDFQGNAGFVGGTYTFNNTASGLLKKSSLGGELAFKPALVNSGGVLIQGGILSLDGGGSSTGTFEFFPDTSLKFNSNYTLNPGTAFIDNPSVQIASGTVTLSAGFTFNPSVLVFAGGGLTGAGTWEIPSNSFVTWSGGVLAGTGATLNQGDLYISGTAAFNGRSLTNQGYISVAPDVSLNLNGNVTFTNAANARFDLTSDKSISPGTGTVLFINQASATLSKSETVGTFTFGMPVQNAGNVEVHSGTLIFSSSFTHTGGNILISSGATMQFNNGLNFASGGLTGAGNLVGNIQSGGVIAPGASPGVLTITGNLTLLSTSILIFELGGTSQGVNYDTIAVTGTAALDGNLSLTFINGFESAVVPGNTFTLLTAPTVTGFFLNAPVGAGPPRLTTTDGFGSFQVNYTPTSVTLSNFIAIPEPSTWALLVTGGLALAVQLRRRTRR